MNIFPLTSDDELMAVENKIDDTYYRNELVGNNEKKIKCIFLC